LSLSALLHEVRRQAAEQLQQAAALPSGVCFRFDTAGEGSSTVHPPGATVTASGYVQKTVCRTVVSLQHGSFRACETVRQATGDGRPMGRSAQLAAIVPSGARYSFDLIAYVGVETYLRGRRLQDLQEQLVLGQPSITIPLSTLWDQQQKFLFYLGALHRQAAPRLREYLAGHGPVTWLLDGTTEPETAVFLLAGRSVEVTWDDTLGREVLLAFHFWILDHRNDGRRRGFPFDPYLLYLHRRLVRAGQAVDQLLSRSPAACRTPQVLRNFQALLQAYRNDSEIRAATDRYERCCRLFIRLREALRLSAEHMDQLRQPQELAPEEHVSLKHELEQLRQELQRQAADEQDPDQPLARIVLTHLDKYWGHILPDLAAGEHWQRTTNQLESTWGGLKRGRRRTHGRGKLTRDFQSLPEEYLLIPNLQNETDLQLVFGGSLDSLPAKLAEASREAGSFDAWRRRRRPRLVGELPRRLLRQDDFIEHLLDTCLHYCQSCARQTA
jgi:hypothetical protein